MRAFGVPATVTRPAPNDTPITEGADGKPLHVAWVNDSTDALPSGIDLQRAEHMKLMAIARTDVPKVERKTIVVAPEVKGGANKTWQVDGTVSSKFDEVRVLVIEV